MKKRKYIVVTGNDPVDRAQMTVIKANNEGEAFYKWMNLMADNEEEREMLDTSLEGEDIFIGEVSKDRTDITFIKFDKSDL